MATRQLLHQSTLTHPRAHATPPPRPPAPSTQSIYLAKLGAAQSQLMTAERQIPTSPRTPAALAHSVELLAAAIHGLGASLAAITPPLRVLGRHAQLVAIVQAYETKLRQAARMAVAPGQERGAGRLLIGSTDQASRSFTATMDAIDSTLASSPS